MRHPDRKHFRLLARMHFWVMFFAFILYLCFGFALGPDFFKRDILERLHVFADDIISVTATVLSGPAKPVVTAIPVCVSGVPHIVLDWGNDTGTITWDIDRNGLPLSTGVVLSQYTDTSVTANTTYSYVVTAYGPMAPGSNISDPVSVTASDCQGILPPATVVIERLGVTNVAVNRSNISMDRQRPQVTGTTNIPNAVVDISMNRPQIEARFAANANGYFSWIPPIDLENGNHILSVTVIDPSDAGRTSRDGFTFRTEDGVDSGSESRGSTSVDTTGIQKASTADESTMDFTVKINNGAQFVFQGDEVNVGILSQQGVFPIGTVFRLFVVDASGKEVLRLSEATIELSSQTALSLMQRIPLSLNPGVYRIRVDAYRRDTIVSRDVRLEIRAWPLVSFGGGTEVTYPEAASFIGSIFFIFLSLFILFLLFFVREYWLYLHHLRLVSERHLDRLGFISPKRKGVVR